MGPSAMPSGGGPSSAPSESPSSLTNFHYQSDPNLEIPILKNLNSTHSLFVSEDFDIKIMDVELDISHGFIGDLVISITSPSQTTVELIHNPPCSRDDYIGLNTFRNERSRGYWIITVSDNVFQDQGK